jgi:AcrR family transcriptional regulator
MARKYKLKQRAERQEETRRRIAQAALELHGSIGPERTTVSAIAERAGVQRHTYYRHFPDERSLGMACSGLHMERDPLPDPDPWRSVADPAARLRRGLGELYRYFERNESLLENVIRDSEIDPITREVTELRLGAPLRAIRDALAEVLPRRRTATAALDLALDFHTWRLLVRRSGLKTPQAVDLMVTTLLCGPTGRGSATPLSALRA